MSRYAAVVHISSYGNRPKAFLVIVRTDDESAETFKPMGVCLREDDAREWAQRFNDAIPVGAGRYVYYVAVPLYQEGEPEIIG